MPDSFRLTSGWFGGTPVLRLAGHMTYGEKLTALHDAVGLFAGDGHDRLVIDMTRVETTDSSGISALLEVRRVFGERSRLFLLCPPERLRSALALARVASLFEVVESETELVSRLGPPRPDASSEREVG
jgi:anti-anti-sigma factor